jgi:hypothetical protein
MPENYRVDIPEVPVPGKPLGRHVNHDPRSLRFQVGQPAGALRSVLHTRAIPVVDQGSLGMCTGAAATGAVGTSPLYDAITDKPTLDLAYARQVYSDATQIDPFRGEWPPTDTGSDGLSVAKVMKSRGLISGYLHATSLSAMQAALQETPVIVGVPWYESMDRVDSAGRISVSGSVRGGHEFEVLGIDVDAGIFRAVNSWGTGYGQRGYFSIRFADMDRLLHEDGDCTQLLPLTVPAPTPTPEPADPWWGLCKGFMDLWRNRRGDG